MAGSLEPRVDGLLSHADDEGSPSASSGPCLVDTPVDVLVSTADSMGNVSGGEVSIMTQKAFGGW